MTTLTPSFGYKMAWFAIKNGNSSNIIRALRLQAAQITSWNDGINKIYENYGNSNAIFVTPQINGWSFVVGWYFFDLNKRDGDIQKLKNYISELSKVFGEVQGFATHRVSEYHHWILARQGKIERCFAFSGDEGKVLCNEGGLTDAEKQFPWNNLEHLNWVPDERVVMDIAGKWSVDPSKLGLKDIPNNICYIAQIPS